MKIPRVNRYTVARAAVVTKKKGQHFLRKVENFSVEHNVNADKFVSTVMFATSLVPKFDAQITKSIVAQDVYEPTNAIVKKAAFSKIIPKKVLPKTADKTKLMAKGIQQNAEKLSNAFNNLLLDNENKKNPLNNKGQIFIREAKNYGVNPEVLMAIALHESARGTSPAVRERHNIGGIMNSKRKLKVFSNTDLCIKQMAEILAFHNKENKINTVKELAYAGKYCAKNEAHEWINGVMYYLNELNR